MYYTANKIEHIEFDFGGKVHGASRECDDLVGEVEKFKYFRICITEEWLFRGKHKSQDEVCTMKWTEASGALCDKRIPIRLKGKFYDSRMVCNDV